jgi:hypothetical protein
MQQPLILRQFVQQKMLHWDPPSTSRHEVRASGEAVFRFGRFCVLPRVPSCWSMGSPSSSAAAPSIC